MYPISRYLGFGVVISVLVLGKYIMAVWYLDPQGNPRVRKSDACDGMCCFLEALRPRLGTPNMIEG